jgi:ABC-type phosphate transport system auxiliary subunit
MSDAPEDDEQQLSPASDAAIEAYRRRVHRLADTVQTHEGKIGEHGVLIGVLTSQVEALRRTTASREQLDHAVAVVRAQMDTIHSENKLRLDNMRDQLEPIRRGVFWAVGLIIGAVLFAIMTLVLNGPPPKP